MRILTRNTYYKYTNPPHAIYTRHFTYSGCAFVNLVQKYCLIFCKVTFRIRISIISIAYHFLNQIRFHRRSIKSLLSRSGVSTNDKRTPLRPECSATWRYIIFQETLMAIQNDFSHVLSKILVSHAKPFAHFACFSAPRVHVIWLIF